MTGGNVNTACSACTHPWAEHDQIAARYCTATIVGHHDRGCVCTMVASATKNNEPAPTTG
jgi:hypothetical protein